MTHGRAIRIFLVDGSPTGIRVVEVGNWTIKAIVAPRAQLARLKDRPEAGRAGVYLLLGEDPDQPGRLRVYVGESDDAVARQDAHARQKDFWDTVVVFVGHDDRLTKAHVRWLESELIRIVGEAQRARLDNGQKPEARMLPEADRAEMSEFLEQIVLVAEVLGLGIFPYGGWGSRPVTDAPASKPTEEGMSTAAFRLDGRAFNASARVTPDGFVVLAGSTIAPDLQASAQAGYRALRERLISEGTVQAAESGLTFTRDYAFRSSSAAATVVSGANRSGRASWKLADGRTLGDWEDAELERAGS